MKRMIGWGFVVCQHRTNRCHAFARLEPVHLFSASFQVYLRRWSHSNIGSLLVFSVHRSPMNWSPGVSCHVWCFLLAFARPPHSAERSPQSVGIEIYGLATRLKPKQCIASWSRSVERSRTCLLDNIHSAISAVQQRSVGFDYDQSWFYLEESKEIAASKLAHLALLTG